MKPMIIAAILFVLMLLGVLVAIDVQRVHHTPDGDASLIEGTCVVINWDAGEETWDAAHAKWTALRAGK